MLRQDFEDVFVENGDYAAVGEVETEHVDDAEGVVLHYECGGCGVEGHYYVLWHVNNYQLQRKSLNKLLSKRYKTPPLVL